MNNFCKGHVLLVGDGDFSFSLSLSKNSSLQPHQITTSNLETEATIRLHSQASASINSLKESGVTVLLEVDARELHIHPIISQKKYDRIIFNFPLADRHNIKKNRALIADFFTSCGQILTDEGEIMITLCRGQGGSPADQPMRSWHNSWQVVAMAANSGFLLRSILPFDVTQYPEYHSVGFRFQDKSFHTEGALTHIFSHAESETGEPNCTRGVVHLEGEIYSCPGYVARKLERNLLKEEWNPIKVSSSSLKDSFTSAFGTNSVSLPAVPLHIAGHKSLLTVRENSRIPSSSLESVAQEHSLDKYSSVCGISSNGLTMSSAGDVDDDDVKHEKDKKNRTNLDKVEGKVSKLAHGHGDAEGNLSQQSQDSKTDQDKNKCLGPCLSSLLPLDPENVCVLVKKNISTACKQGNDQNEDEKIGSTQCKVGSPDDEATKEKDTDMDVTQTDDSEMDTHETSVPSYDSPSQEVNHCRVSLLEALPQVLPLIRERVTKICDEPELTPMCFLMEGQCVLPCSIATTHLPVRHEVMILKPVMSVSSAKRTSALPVSGRTDLQSFDSARRCLTSGIENSCFFKDRFNLTAESICETFSLALQGAEHVSHLHFLWMKSSEDEQDAQSNSIPIGYFCQVDFNDGCYFTAVLILDNIARQVFTLPDSRLLWCMDPRFLHKPSESLSSSFQHLFKPPSLYPMKYVHDVSFWLSHTDFDEQEMYDIVRNLTDDLVVKVSLQDEYSDLESGKKSRCYRLHFLSHDKALSYSASWKLQSFVRLELAKRLRITLR